MQREISDKYFSEIEEYKTKKIKKGTRKKRLSKLGGMSVIGKKNVVISPNQLRVFRFLRKNDFEVGGYLDFETKRRIERFLSYFGDRVSVNFPNIKGYEVDFHTHPDYHDGRIFNPPSPSDLGSLLIAAIEDGLQVSLVFADEGVYVITPTEELIQSFIDLTENERLDFISLLDDTVENAFEASHDPPDTSYDNPYYTLVRNFGFKIRLHDYEKNLYLRLYMTEPDQSF